MGEVPLSLHIKAETSRRLEEEAQRQDVSPAHIAKQALTWYLESRKHQRQLSSEHAAEASAGLS
ncbi:hypothetical protein [Tianweitania sp.]|uniref:hypothetical protein n=1 Tax=Tianweitania sp. TaxID=2021634 RepID=UPI0028A1B642|nr:hypothetical protein [Tianweitania sp.]